MPAVRPRRRFVEALVRLRAFADAQDRPIDEVAAMVVSGTLRFDDESP